METSGVWGAGMSRLRQALARQWRWWERRAGQARRALGSLAATKGHAEQGRDGNLDRAHFWTEFREGQREADSKCLEAAARACRDI